MFESFAPAVYGFLKQQQLSDESAGLLLHRIFEEAYRKIQETEKGETRLLLWLMAIARQKSADTLRQQEFLKRFETEINKLRATSTEELMEMPQAGKLLFDALHLYGCELEQLMQKLDCSKEQIGMAIRKSLTFSYQTN